MALDAGSFAAARLDTPAQVTWPERQNGRTAERYALLSQMFCKDTAVRRSAGPPNLSLSHLHVKRAMEMEAELLNPDAISDTLKCPASLAAAAFQRFPLSAASLGQTSWHQSFPGL